MRSAADRTFVESATQIASSLWALAQNGAYTVDLGLLSSKRRIGELAAQPFQALEDDLADWHSQSTTSDFDPVSSLCSQWGSIKL